METFKYFGVAVCNNGMKQNCVIQIVENLRFSFLSKVNFFFTIHIAGNQITEKILGSLIINVLSL